MTDHFTKEIRTFPRRREGTNSARAHATNRAQVGIVGEAVILAHFREDFLLQEGHIVRAQRIVFHRAIALHSPSGSPVLLTFNLVRVETGIEKDPDRDRHLSPMNEIVKDHRNADVALLPDVGVAILKDHHDRRRDRADRTLSPERIAAGSEMIG